MDCSIQPVKSPYEVPLHHKSDGSELGDATLTCTRYERGCTPLGLHTYDSLMELRNSGHYRKCLDVWCTIEGDLQHQRLIIPRVAS